MSLEQNVSISVQRGQTLLLGVEGGPSDSRGSFPWLSRGLPGFRAAWSNFPFSHQLLLSLDGCKLNLVQRSVVAA